MNIFTGAIRAIARTAEATTAAAGAVGDAAINGVVGGMQGAATGVKTGLSRGSHSTPAAALTLAAIGAAGLVEWPVLLGIGGAALAMHQLNQRYGDRQTAPRLTAVSDTASTSSRSASPKKRAPARTAAKPAKSPAKSAARTSTARGRRSPAKR